jgi:hypothetical protein
MTEVEQLFLFSILPRSFLVIFVEANSFFPSPTNFRFCHILQVPLGPMIKAVSYDNS